jgi:hypothetical protein
MLASMAHVCLGIIAYVLLYELLGSLFRAEYVEPTLPFRVACQVVIAFKLFATGNGAHADNPGPLLFHAILLSLQDRGLAKYGSLK